MKTIFRGGYGVRRIPRCTVVSPPYPDIFEYRGFVFRWIIGSVTFSFRHTRFRLPAGIFDVLAMFGGDKEFSAQFDSGPGWMGCYHGLGYETTDFIGSGNIAGACTIRMTSGFSSRIIAATAADDMQEKGSNMLWKKDGSADKIVVVSDLHFGVDDGFSQNVADRSLFVDFIGGLVEVGDVRELVIAGDFLDEWIVPLGYPAYSDSDAFYRRCISNNQQVFDALEEAIEAGIKVVYVPGNHDMLLTADVLKAALPSLVQARDANGLGVYITGDRNEIAIEHCHRYDVYSAPDTVSNRDLAGNDRTMLPPGYFYARLGTEWVAEGKPSNTVDYPEIEQVPDPSDTDQTGAYLHYKVMTSILLTQYTPDVGFDEKVFQTHIAGLDGSYSEYDLCPRLMDDGTISSPTLYPDFQRTWNDRQKANNVKVGLSFIEAAAGTGKAEYFRSQASRQYIDNPDSDIEVVVFGHSHVPDFHDFGNGRYYVNDGTWIDVNLDAAPDLTGTFAVVATGPVSSAALYRYNKDGSASDISVANTDA